MSVLPSLYLLCEVAENGGYRRWEYFLLPIDNIALVEREVIENEEYVKFHLKRDIGRPFVRAKGITLNQVNDWFNGGPK